MLGNWGLTMAELQRLTRAGRARLRPACGPGPLEELEARWHVRLPGDYRRFILSISDGVEEPASDIPLLFALGACWDLGSDRAREFTADAVGDLSRDFPLHLIPAGEEEDGFAWEWADGPPPGALPLSYRGDTNFIYLVTAGPECGHVWEHEAGSFYPVANRLRRRAAFLEWLGLDLERLAERG